jgi:hypothetical protein
MAWDYGAYWMEVYFWSALTVCLTALYHTARSFRSGLPGHLDTGVLFESPLFCLF